MDGMTALENVLDADAPVELYSVAGASLGKYGSMVEAMKHLNPGTYVMTNGSQSQTIVVK